MTRKDYIIDAIVVVLIIAIFIIASMLTSPQEDENYIPVCEREYTVNGDSLIDSTYQTLER